MFLPNFLLWKALAMNFEKNVHLHATATLIFFTTIQFLKRHIERPSLIVVYSKELSY